MEDKREKRTYRIWRMSMICVIRWFIMEMIFTMYRLEKVRAISQIPRSRKYMMWRLQRIASMHIIYRTYRIYRI